MQKAYRLEDPEEIIEYMWLRPFHTNLKVDVFADDGGSYIRHNHEPLLLVRNSYNKEYDEFIPFALSDNPIILDNTIDYQIAYSDIFDIQDFIKTNLPLLLKLADSEISQIDFIHSLK